MREGLAAFPGLFDEDDLEQRAGLVALVHLFDAHEANDDDGIDAAEQALDKVTHVSRELLRRARRDVATAAACSLSLKDCLRARAARLRPTKLQTGAPDAADRPEVGAADSPRAAEESSFGHSEGCIDRIRHPDGIPGVGQMLDTWRPSSAQ